MTGAINSDIFRKEIQKFKANKYLNKSNKSVILQHISRFYGFLDLKTVKCKHGECVYLLISFYALSFFLDFFTYHQNTLIK